MSLQILNGNCLDILPTLPEKSVHCCVTSPPYWGLRDYGLEPSDWPGEDYWEDDKTSVEVCPPWRGCFGLEPTPDLYVIHAVQIFREVRRVLRDDATLWLNLGDSYGTGTRADRRPGNKLLGAATAEAQGIPRHGGMAKQLIGIPWRVAFALQADGWYLRSDIIWRKPNPMPESVTDRPTKSHEYIFLLTKNKKYYYDAEAIKEEAKGWHGSKFEDGKNAIIHPGVGKKRKPAGWDTGKGAHGSFHRDGRAKEVEYTEGTCDTRNKRSVWTVATAPYSEAHFATFPPKLIEPCILAGCPEKVCPDCGAGWERVVEKTGGRDWHNDKMKDKGIPGQILGENGYKRGQSSTPLNNAQDVTTTGFKPSCSCGLESYEPGTVLDPFGGSGTTAQVAIQHRRKAILIELNPEYIKLQEKRTSNVEVRMF